MSEGRIFVTGASKGLGWAIAHNATMNHIWCGTHGRNCGDIWGDITNSETQNHILKFVEENDVEFFINNAAVYSKKPLNNFSPEEIKKTVEVNLIAPMILSRGVLEIFKKKEAGRLYNINSLAGIQATAGEAVYCATKFGLKGFSDALREEFRPYKNIQIVNVTLGAFQSKMTEGRDNYDELPTDFEVADLILDHICKDHGKLKTDLVITRK